MDMLEDLSKLAGTTHVSRITGKTFSKKHGAIEVIDENVSYNVQENEERLFTVDDLMSFTNGEAMVLTAVTRSGNSGEAVRPNPVHNTKDRLLPMAWALHEDGHNSSKFKTEFGNAEVATSVTNTNVIDDIPDFNRLYEKRLQQASYVKLATQQYMDQMGVSEDELILMDSDTVADEVMRRINAIMNGSTSGLTDAAADDLQEQMQSYNDNKEQFEEASKSYIPNEQREHQKERENAQLQAKQQEDAKEKKRYLNGILSYRDFESGSNVQDVLTDVIFNNIQNLKDMINDERYYITTKETIDDYGEPTQNVVLVDKKHGFNIARLESVEHTDDNGNTDFEDRWSVTHDFSLLLQRVAKNGSKAKMKLNEGDKTLEDILIDSQEDVEDCFEIAKSSYIDIKKAFENKFRQDILQND